MKIVSSAGEGRNWKPSKTDEEYNADMIRESIDDFAAVAEETGRTVTELTIAISMRATKEGSPWQ
ncbi:hypothetical protein KVH27_27935 [Streptomyces olivaceus]|uniref:hypothetical protein n=1 Tax=Streptomyces olivaceus TaxID=47716 RepID=UPI001CCAD5DF|nr:hypothetical protein [Streptomyces olivaceus]MBZ6252182.1 hypothetical protein [Streptomyces olivaceus]